MISSPGSLRSGHENHHIFWGELAPSEHIVHFYDDDGGVLDSLEDFIVSGLENQESVIVLALGSHLEALEDRLVARGVNVDSVRKDDQYITVDAEQFLPTFIVRGWPDEDLFRHAILDLLARARKNDRRVRAFGELVALLWAQGHKGATVRLEHMWHEICQSEMFSLYCAYPQTGFPQEAAESIQEICAAHSTVIGRDSVPFRGPSHLPQISMS